MTTAPPHIRPAEARDAVAIAGMVNAVIRDTTVTFRSGQTSAADQAAVIADRNADTPKFLVAEADGKVLGFATFFPFRNPDGYRHSAEHTVVLEPEARGKGTGALLMEALFVQARLSGIHALFAGVSAENTAGIVFHSRLGFTEVGRLPEAGRKFDRWLTLVLMQKILSD